MMKMTNFFPRRCILSYPYLECIFLEIQNRSESILYNGKIEYVSENWIGKEIGPRMQEGLV